MCVCMCVTQTPKQKGRRRERKRESKKETVRRKVSTRKMVSGIRTRKVMNRLERKKKYYTRKKMGNDER